jgi:hypothetical protein
MDGMVGCAVRRESAGRRTPLVMVNRTENGAVVRAVASAAALALLALTALSSLGSAQSRRDTSGWARVGQVMTRPKGDTIADRRDSVAIDAASIASSVRAMADSVARVTPLVPIYRSRNDSVTSVRTKAAADRESGLRIVISLNERRLWVLIGPDTLLKTTVAVSTDETLEYAGRTWRFETPRGLRSVIAKRADPVWIPPEWHYAEVAKEHGLKLAVMKPGRTVLSDGNWLEVREDQVGVVDARTGEFAFLPTDEEVIFDSTLFVPPVGSINRRIEGELGRHMLDTGNGFLLHGTPHKASIGTAATHGCIRLRDEDIEWLHDMVPVGTRVYIY